MDPGDEADEIALMIFADCCYSGNWCRILEGKRKEKLTFDKSYNLLISIWAACAHDEVATENVFTDLLKG